MKIYHFILLFWLLFVTMWILNTVSSRHRERERARLKSLKK